MVLLSSLPDTKTQKGRVFAYKGTRELGVLLIEGRDRDLYLVQWDDESGCWLLANQTDEEAAIYQCDGRVCDCWGFRKHRVCKHKLTLESLGFVS